MKYVICSGLGGNARFGGFSVSQEWCKAHGYNYCSDSKLRTDAKLIAAIENGEDVNSGCVGLKVIEIPDNATDWELNKHYGRESIICVVNGKIRHL